MDTISPASAKNLQEVVDFNIQDSGHSDCIRERPESFGHPSPEEKRKEQSYKTEEHRAGRGAAWSFSHLLPDKGRHKAHRVTEAFAASPLLWVEFEFLELGELKLLNLPIQVQTIREASALASSFALPTPCLRMFLHSLENWAISLGDHCPPG